MAGRAFTRLIVLTVAATVPLAGARAAPPEPSEDTSPPGAPTGDAQPGVGEDAGPPAQGEIDRARQLADNGRRLFREGSFRAAIEAFESAYERAADPNLLFNIALSYERLEEWEAAIAALDRYRAYALPDEREALETRRRTLQDRLAQEREAAEAGPTQPEGPATSGATGDGRDGTDAGEPQRVPLVTGVGYTLGGVAVVSLGVGITLGSVALGQVDASRRDCATVDGVEVCTAQGGERRARARGLAVGADVAYAVSAVAATGFVVALVVQASKRQRARNVAVTPTVGFAGGGLSVRGRF